MDQFVLITWNLDGLDPIHLEARTESVAQTIRKEKPLIVLLQEVVKESETILRQRLPEYEFYSGNTNISPYYTLSLVQKNDCTIISNEIIEFEKTRMDRNLLKTVVTIGSASVCLMNTHLESMTHYKAIRCQQLKTAFQLMSEQPTEQTVLFGGDLNLEDEELKAIGGIPGQMYDLWEKTGSRAEVRYTWDLNRNDNKTFDKRLNSRPDFRFDRIYVRPSLPVRLNPIGFDLIGLTKIENILYYPSDHFGIRTGFMIQ